eukprot:TRINITY_DN8911_c0_g1_i4.p1 TRINITY_DN8911_c0_g1~~TRINITY_DN8911_c0_g1_i4.p1  ORF type:complete len:161 (+),score=20.56 TRINITY_DN8911_c0_g1_i4:182-664(+)
MAQAKPKTKGVTKIKGVTVKDVAPEKFIAEYAAHLKRNQWLKLPDWIDLVKTSNAKELAPLDPDWYYIRAASVARKIYLRGGLGIGSFRVIYGGNKRRGVMPSRFTKASGAVLRHVVKQLESIGVVEKSTSSEGGRRITQEGRRDLDRIAGRVHSKAIHA